MESPRWKRITLVVVTALVGFVSLGAWAIASPVGAAPDDDFHLASIWCSLGDREGLCAEGTNPTERIVPSRLLESSKCFKQKPTVSAACPLDDRTTMLTSRGNFAGNYPPVFYATMGIFASPDIAVSTVLMRVFNAALFVGAVSVLLALLRGGQRGALLWAGVAGLVPLGMFIIPSVNPSSWAVLAGLTVWLAVYGFFTAETRPRRIALAGFAVVLAIMGAGARGDSAVFVAGSAVLGAILAFERSRRWLLRAILPAGIILIGAVFFLAAGQSTGAASVGVVEGGSLVATGDSGALEASNASGLGLLFANLIDLPFLWTGGTGTWGLGWLDTTVPPAVWVFMIGILITVAVLGLRVMDRRKATATIATLAALTMIPLYVLHGYQVRVGEQVQPRYLLPLLLILLGVLSFGFARDHLTITRLQAIVLFAGVAVANALSLHNNMRRYITGLGDGGGFNLNANIEWWWSMPISPMLVWIGGSAAFALTLAGLFLLLYPKDERPTVGDGVRAERVALPA